MTNKEWDELKLPVPIRWSIYDEGTTDQEDIDDWVLDLSTDAPDGVYEGVSWLGHRLHGITVKDGKFDPFPTAITLYKLVIADYDGKYGDQIDHQFVEIMKFVCDDNSFEVHMGS